MSLIDRFLTGTYKVSRMKRGSYVNGFYVEGCLQEIEMRGSLQSTNARELKLPEEGDRLKTYYKFYSDQPLLTDNTKSLASSDIVTIDGETYRVMSVEKWAGVDLPYFKSIVYRTPEQ